MNGLRLILHAIVDPHMRRYHTTSPHFLVLPQPGTTLYRTGTALLCYLSPVSLLCLLMDWSLTRQWDLYAILTTLFVISTGLYAFAAATEQWLRSRTDNVLDRGWSHLYQVLIDFRRHDDIRHVLRTALDQHDRLSNHAYAHLIPEIAAHWACVMCSRRNVEASVQLWSNWL